MKVEHRKKFARGIRILFTLALLLTVVGCAGKSADGKEEKEQAESLEIDESDKPVYTFVDVLGQEYEAELLENVPKHTYDYGRLTEKNGYKYYTNEAGEITSKLGVDVSKYQGDIDWTQVKNAGIDFAIIRLGVRGYGAEGNIVEDDHFRRNMEGALAVGIEVGVYFFSQAVDEIETLEEVQFVVERIKDYEIAGPVVFDTEEIKDAEARTDGLSGTQFTENCKTFCDAIKKEGYQSMIYANMKWMAFTLDMEALVDYDKWYADYEPEPQCPYAFQMWQYTESGQVPGIEGNVDLNVRF